MLKTKHIFILLFLALFAIFALSVYLLVSSNIQTLLFKQYEQKLKTLDDLLRFKLLDELNPQNIKEFAAKSRADYIIVQKAGLVLSKNALNAKLDGKPLNSHKDIKDSNLSEDLNTENSSKSLEQDLKNEDLQGESLNELAKEENSSKTDQNLQIHNLSAESLTLQNELDINKEPLHSQEENSFNLSNKDLNSTSKNKRSLTSSKDKDVNLSTSNGYESLNSSTVASSNNLSKNEDLNDMNSSLKQTNLEQNEFEDLKDNLAILGLNGKTNDTKQGLNELGATSFKEANSSKILSELKSKNEDLQEKDEDLKNENEDLKGLDEGLENEFFLREGRTFSSLDEPYELLSLVPDSIFFDSRIYEILLNGKKALVKAYTFEDYRYLIAVYPRILELQGYWSKVFVIFVLCVILFFILLQIFANKLNLSFKKILFFLDNINKEGHISLQNSFFKELNLLNDKLYKSKNELLKKQNLIKKQNAKISLKNTQLSSIISAISHELKNPLSVIELSLSTLKEQDLDKDTKSLMLDKIHEQCLKLDTLTSKLNFVFNLNELALQKKHFDIYALCEKLVLNPLYKRVRIRGKSCEVLADELLIEQVLINLLTNALKYSQKEVYLVVTPLKNELRISIKDRGIGIEEDKLKLITKKFYKIDPSSENSFGIGLFLVKKILALHRSELQIQSELGKGSKFSFKLDLA
ncbi:sensor histidine kinase [Campylobacter troglodytis]|uniref:sensor histidine kinase n=1 Tax=Campylobacter troglodytis TaxID=654363 RepID=UPI00115809D6|nr:HAMP domain-containing sensor histidine kinase [Campylobacter troglodytis]TQR54790.1 hypothetical protein DMC01_09880 [Campylobacter troglodytis]